MRGPNLDLKARILDRVDRDPGAVWTPVDFLDLGARAAVDKALQRLAKDGALRRVDRGLYDKPSTNVRIPAMPPRPWRAGSLTPWRGETTPACWWTGRPRPTIWA